MRQFFRTLLTCATVSTLFWAGPVGLRAGFTGATMEGRVLGLDGRPAEGYVVHLIDAEGRPAGRSEIDSQGLYVFASLPSGVYALGIENPAGQIAPVDAPPVRLGERELSRRDLQLMSAEQWSGSQLVQRNYGLGTWWASLTPGAKSWSVVALVAVAGITWAMLDEDDPQASTFQPGTPAN